MKNIRNFSIIAHIDHGKSTLADRLLELTGTVPPRQMKEQILDAMALEQERGITIKMTPVTMLYRQPPADYKLNLIDTPGHLDFAYEVSRALRAVEGAILLVDATKGVQAQTLSVLQAARAAGLTLVPAVNKIDLASARTGAVKLEISQLLKVSEKEIFEISAKTGQGVAELLAGVISRIPSPVLSDRDGGVAVQDGIRALVFDFDYSDHRGLIVYVRVFDGAVKPGDKLVFAVSGDHFTAAEIGYFTPAPRSIQTLSAGEIGYIVTGLKDFDRAKVGETILRVNVPQSLIPGYDEPKPMVWASLYPASQDHFVHLRQALGRLKLSDAALSFEEEAVGLPAGQAGVLGRGFRIGCLGLLHLEIVVERLRREYGLKLLVTAAAVSFRLVNRRTGRGETIYAHHLFPSDLRDQEVTEQYAAVEILTPPAYLSPILTLSQDYEAAVLLTDNWSEDRMILKLAMPVRELLRRFFDQLKNVSSGFASLSYRLIDWRPAAVLKLEVLVAGEAVPALARIVPRRRLTFEAETIVERLKTLLPRELFAVKIQARADGRIIASRTLPALKKDVTGYLYGGDITRKRKLWAKQAKGKKRLAARGRVVIPPEVFLKLV